MAKKSPSQNWGPLALIGAGVVIIVSLIIWQVAQSSPTASKTAAAAIPYPQIVRTSLSDAKVALDQSQAVFVDVRDLDVYKTSHISGSISIPLGEIETRYKELDANKWIILYCT